LALPRLGIECLARPADFCYDLITASHTECKESIVNPCTRTSYQEGTFTQEPRAKGPAAWLFRWREYHSDGTFKNKKEKVGDVKQYPRLADIKNAPHVIELRATINARNQPSGKITIFEAWQHFKDHELDAAIVERSQSTKDNYHTLFEAHILPVYGTTPLEDMLATEVESWLSTRRWVKPEWRARRERLAILKAEQQGLPIPEFAPMPLLAAASKIKIKSRMQTLFAHAKRHRLFFDESPIPSVRTGTPEPRDWDQLDHDECRALMQQIRNRAIRVAVLVAASSGFRQSEVRGLRWRDINFGDGSITAMRGAIRSHFSKLKTKASRKKVFVPEALMVALRIWREETPYPMDDDFVFASPEQRGRGPYWFDSALDRQLRPAAQRAGIDKLIGWHTFRRAIASLMVDKEESIKTVQEMLRHADPRTTLKLYAQGNEKSKRAATRHLDTLFLVDKAS
jgi:integrase